MRFLTVIALALGLAGCLKAEMIDASTRYAAAQIVLWNDAGVDPIKVDERTRGRMLLACGSVAGLAAVIYPHKQSYQDAVIGFCALADQVAE